MTTTNDTPSTVSALLQAVGAAGGDVSAIYVGTGNPEDRYAVVHTIDGWQVYYSEKGHKLEFKAFPSEAQACAYAMLLLREDQTVWWQERAS